jgi:GATA-binding protein
VETENNFLSFIFVGLFCLSRSIEELEAPGFKRNHSTDIIRQRAAEKERSREANINGRPGTIKRMQFTFSVDQPTPAASAGPVQKPDLKPSAEFKDNITRRIRPVTRSTATQEDTLPESASDSHNDNDNRRNDTDATSTTISTNHQDALLRFPSLFSSDFGPSALLYPTPTVTNPMNYGEGVRHSFPSNDSFDIVRPTIELPLDELLMEPGDCSEAWTFASTSTPDSQSQSRQLDLATDSEMGMKSESFEHHPAFSQAHFARRASQQEQTVSPSKLGHRSDTPTGSNPSRPTLSVRTQGATTRSSGPGATATNPPTALPQPGANGSNAPGGVKAECSNCGATHTPLWRRGLNDELNCNACGLYCKLHKRPRPKSMRNNHGEGRSQAAPRQESSEIIAQCYNCHTTATPLWRKDDEGKTVCNACGLYFKLHGSARPISMKSDVIRKRSRHDSRRGSTSGNGAGNASETPSASPGASRRPSPNGDADGDVSPTLAIDSNPGAFDDPDLDPSSSHSAGSNNFNFAAQTQSELVGALGTANVYSYPTLNLSNFPGPYHPDLLSQLYSTDYNTSSGDNSEGESGVEIREAKRRRMSNDSATEPPSSAVSFSSFGRDSTSFSTSSATSVSSSARNSMDFSFSASGNSPSNGAAGNCSPNMGGGNNNASNGNNGPGAGSYYSSYWHPPMLPQPHGSPFIHPPMLPPSSTNDNDVQMDFLHGSADMGGTDHFLNSYIHPPMLLPEPHPPMLPSDWSGYSTDGVGAGATGF